MVEMWTTEEKVSLIRVKGIHQSKVCDREVKALCAVQIAEYKEMHHICFLVCVKSRYNMFLVRDLSLIDLLPDSSTHEIGVDEVKQLYEEKNDDGCLFHLSQLIQPDDYLIDWGSKSALSLLRGSIFKANEPKDNPFLSAWVSQKWNESNQNVARKGDREPESEYIDRVACFSAFPSGVFDEVLWLHESLEGKRKAILGE